MIQEHRKIKCKDECFCGSKMISVNGIWICIRVIKEELRKRK